jgi:hypothetical protein
VTVIICIPFGYPASVINADLYRDGLRWIIDPADLAANSGGRPTRFGPYTRAAEGMIGNASRVGGRRYWACVVSLRGLAGAMRPADCGHEVMSRRWNARSEMLAAIRP